MANDQPKHVFHIPEFEDEQNAVVPPVPNVFTQQRLTNRTISDSSVSNDGHSASTSTTTATTAVQSFSEAFSFVRTTEAFTGQASTAILPAPIPTTSSFSRSSSAMSTESSADTSVEIARTPSGPFILVSQRQRGNPVLKYIKHVPWEFHSVVPDYVLGQTTCALYLRRAALVV